MSGGDSASEWRRVPGFEQYEVSNSGEIRSTRRPGSAGGILRPYPNADGYLTVPPVCEWQGKDRQGDRRKCRTHATRRVMRSEVPHERGHPRCSRLPPALGLLGGALAVDRAAAMSVLVPDPEHPDAYIVGSAAEETFGIQVGAVVLRNVHPPEKCAGEPCLVHNPSDHHMREWPLNWRGDRGLMERTCPHGVGHPDPDSLAFHVKQGREWQGVHGCDGCCR